MSTHYRPGDDLIEAPSLPAPEVVKVRVVLIHGATGRCEQVTEEADYAPLLVDPEYRSRLLSDLGRQAAVKMTRVRELPPDEPKAPPASDLRSVILNLEPQDPS